MASGQATQSEAKRLTGRLAEVALECQRALEANPRQPQALVGMSLVALASGQAEGAAALAQAAVAEAPGMVAAWVALGQAEKLRGRAEDAERAFAAALRLDGTNALAWTGLGELRLAMGLPREAMAEYERALGRNPAMAAAHMGRGHALACMGRNEEALECYETALGFAPRVPETEFAAAFVLARMGRAEEAIARYRKVLTLKQDFAPAWMNLGCLLREQGQEFHAEAALLRAVELRPDLITGWINLALIERERRNPAKAEAHLWRAFVLDPENVATLVAWCQFRAAEKDLAGAWQWLKWALARREEDAEAVNMQGILLHMEGLFEEAIAVFERAEALGSHAAASNRGNSLLDMGHMEEALHAHENAAERHKESAGAEYNLALTRLRLGDWERGWAQYEARRRFREVTRAPVVFKVPRWRGEALEGRRILLHAEQGLGDAIQFCRYVPLVTARGGHAIVQVHAGVERLMRSLGAVRGGQAEVARLGEAPPEFELECPLMSLPGVFGTRVETVPWMGAYLGADEELARQKRVEFARKDDRPRVGVAWAGNPKYGADGRRSTQVETLLPLLRMNAVEWMSLQKGEAAEQLKRLPADVRVVDGASRERDLAETAALMTTLDLVITTDTSVAHLAGAMGLPVWILLAKPADWRWMEERETTPWYPTARLFRQAKMGDWEGLMERVRSRLEAWIPLQMTEK
ncbi:MAG TPA: tetratricopeptide repeat protein [Terracidiphilus sp.]|nr:tetratricopeptide repeat protein [Terracidiphilus sp.]